METEPVETSDGVEYGRGALYIRVSTEDQAKKFGLEVQLERGRAYFETRGWGEPVVYADVESGAATENRAKYQEMLKAIERREYDRVVALKLDRFGRDVMALLDFAYKKVKPYGCELVCIEQGLDTTSPMGKLLFVIVGVMAEMERSTIVSRTVGGKKMGMTKGRWWGGKSPYGYQPGHKKDHVGVLQVDEYEAAVVREMYRLRYEEKKTMGGVAKALNDKGMLTRAAKDGSKPDTVWSENNLRDMFSKKRRWFYMARTNQFGESMHPNHEAILLVDYWKDIHLQVDPSPVDWNTGVDAKINSSANPVEPLLDDGPVNP